MQTLKLLPGRGPKGAPPRIRRKSFNLYGLDNLTLIGIFGQDFSGISQAEDAAGPCG